MNSLRRRAYGLAAFLIVAGGVSMVHMSQAATTKKTEGFLEEHAPRVLPGYTMELGPGGETRYTYKMDEGTYATLHPFGIVARQFTNGNATFDAVLISSDSHESFHDPKICFSAQGWTLGEMHEETVDVPGRGKIPFTIVQMSGPRSTSIAAYCYRGPNGFVASPKVLQLDMFREVLFGRKPMDSTFYRFMPMTEGVGLPELKEFIKVFMAACPKASGGYF